MRNREYPRVLVILALISSILLATGSWAQDDNDADDDTALGQTLQVTGSRISRTDLEGPQPVTVLTADEIQRQGFTTAFEALNSLTQFNGTIQDDQFAGGFTQAANSLDLRALGPGRTLILINGRRTTDYPLPFNGQSNIVNLASIPSVMIERIEILSSGASAIYGSDAIAGVVNFILRKNLDSHTINLRLGDTSEGGERSERLQLAGGFNPGNFHITYGVEYFNRDPIWAFDRDFQDSFLDDPSLTNPTTAINDPANGVVNNRTFLVLDPFDQDGDGNTYIDPGAATCASLSQLVFGSVEYSLRPGGRGFYCGSNRSVAYQTDRNAKENLTLFTNFSYEFSPDLEFFGTVNYTDTQTKFNVGGSTWQYDPNGVLNGGFFINTNGPDLLGVGGRVELWQRQFSYEETGANDIDKLGLNTNHFDEELLDIALGFRGVAFNGLYDWEISYTHSEYDTVRKRRLLTAGDGDQFFLGNPQGTIDLGFGQPFVLFNADINRLYTPLTPADIDQISAIDRTSADSSNDALQFVFSGDLFDLPAGPLQFATVLEWGSQDYDIQIDPGLVNGRFLFFTGTGGGGERDRYAAGVEFRVPVFDTLSATVAGRFDKYDDITDVDDAFTYNLGLEWRPTANFLARGSVSTSFRAPDMHFVFADPSGFFATPRDEYWTARCDAWRTGQPWNPVVPVAGEDPNDPNGPRIADNADPSTFNAQACFSTASPQGIRQGNPALQEEEGDSWTVGFVWEILDNLSLSADYYSIKLDGIVQDLSTRNLLRDERDCRLGILDPNSPTCQNTFARITRTRADSPDITTAGTLNTITVGPINTALEEVEGVDANLRYTLLTDKLGTWSVDLGYNLVTKNDSQQFPGDPITNELEDLQDFDFRSRFRGSLNWDIGNFSSTLFWLRTGSVPNWAETDRCCTHTVYNFSSQYHFNDNAKIGLFVQNLLDDRPPVDNTYNSWPYYSTFNFDPFGREVFLEFEYQWNNN